MGVLKQSPAGSQQGRFPGIFPVEFMPVAKGMGDTNCPSKPPCRGCGPLYASFQGTAVLPHCRKKKAAGVKGREKNKGCSMQGDFASCFTVPGTSGKCLRLCADDRECSVINWEKATCLPNWPFMGFKETECASLSK